MTKSDGATEESLVRPPTITTLSVAGFKSISDEQTIEIRPLTLLAGANSSGKSSMMQPLLLLKQTLEAQYDPGPLLLNGPNVKFTSARQFYPVTSGHGRTSRFVVTTGTSDGAKFAVGFAWESKGKHIKLAYNIFYFNDSPFKVSETMSVERAREFLSARHDAAYLGAFDHQVQASKIEIRTKRFFFEIHLTSLNKDLYPDDLVVFSPFSSRFLQFMAIGHPISEVIHLPGLRGNPERTYPVTSIGPLFPGAFEHYAASLISYWSSESPEKIKELGDDLRVLGLTWKIEAKRIDDTQVALRVGRLPSPRRSGARDLVNIADVGSGVAQTLPVVVGLRAARPGQLVYIEQPETHLHPRAQVAMARLLVHAAKRGVQVVAETHSSLLLLAVQTLVAEGEIDPGLVKLNWFLRNVKNGTTRIQSADLDEAGRFGDWPEDFDDVALKTESRYLSAAEARLARS